MTRSNRLFLIFTTMAAAVLLSAVIVYLTGLRVSWANVTVFQRRQVVEGVERTLSDLRDAETGQRGFLLTGEDKYLEPYNDALSHLSVDLRQLNDWAAAGKVPAEQVQEVTRLTQEKLDELAQTIRLRRSDGFEAAVAVVHSDVGERIMDEVRRKVAVMVKQQEDEFDTLWWQRDQITLVRTLITALMAVLTCGFLLWAYRRIGRDVAEIERERELLGVTLASIGDGVIVTDAQGRVSFLNGEAERLTGWKSQEASGQTLPTVFKIINEESRQTVESPVDKVLRLGTVVGLANHTILIARDGRETPIDDSGAPIRQSNGTVQGVVLVFRDFSEQKMAEREREADIEFLRLVNGNAGTGPLVEAAVKFFQDRSGCEAVGIRLQAGDDYPYYETRGFSGGFVLAENSLCSRNASGEVERDAAGNPIHACMCGSVVCGRIDATKPFFTAAGSFWTNSTTELLASTTEADRQARTRNRCNGEGYQSVALIPLRFGEERLGLLQLNDKRADRFSPAIIARWERLAGYLAVALAKCRVEEALQTHRHLLEAVVNHMPAAVNLIRGSDLRIQLANPAYQAIAPGKAMVGKTLDELWPEAQGGFSDLCRNVLATGEPYHAVDAPSTIRRTDNGASETAYFTWSLYRVRLPAEEGWAILNTAWETTQRVQALAALRESEQRFRSLAEAMPQLAWTANPDGFITWYNRRWYEYTGTTPEQMEGWGWQSVHDPAMLPTVLERWKASIAAGEPFEMEFPLRGADGSFRQFLTRAEPMRDAQGQVVQWFGTNTDVDALKRAEEDLKAAKRSAEQARTAAEAASRAKDQFIAVLSHELRNPLNPVLATAAMLRDDPRFDADTREQLEVICRNAELEARLIDDLLDVTRIERGKVELDRRPIELTTIIRRATEVCMPDIQTRELEFGIDAPDGPYWVDADAGRLQQVFWNLLKNAIKFTPKGGCVGIRCRREADGHVIAEVNDSGEGIGPEVLPRLFNAFEQGGRPTTRQFGGLGLGLTISKAMVEMHDGSIRAYSEGKGKGASFTVRLPLLSAEANAMAAPSAAEATLTTVGRRALHILLVEDHGDSARIMRRLLEADGHTIQIAADVVTALGLAGNQAFDLLLSDLGLPDGSGLDLMRTLRAKGIALPGIALSGYGQEKDLQQSRAAGFKSHLVKPVDMRRLREAIARVISGEESTDFGR